MAEHNQQFDTFQEWVNKASSWLTRRGRDVHATCFDARGRVINDGAGFMRANKENAFPVRWLWPSQLETLLIRCDFEALIAGDEEDELTAEQLHDLTHNLGQCGGTHLTVPIIPNLSKDDTRSVIISDEE